jgi:putative ABC transport system permease protein
MKKVVYGSLLVTLLLAVISAFMEVKEKEYQSLIALEDAFTIPFIVPESLNEMDPTLFYQSLQNAAITAKVNVFRSALYYSPDEEIEIKKYILTITDTQFFNYLTIDGRLLAPFDTQTTNQYLSSYESNAEVIGKPTLFDKQQKISIRPLQQSFAYLPITGSYFLEGEEKQALFFAELCTQIATSDATFACTQEDFQAGQAVQRDESLHSTYDPTFLQMILFISIVSSLFFLFYYIFTLTKSSAVYQLHGVRLTLLWWEKVGRFICCLSCTVFLLALIFALFWGEASWFIEQVFLYIGGVFISFMVLSVLAFVCLTFISITKSVKNKKLVQPLFISNIFLKIGCIISLLSMMTTIYEQYRDINSAKQLLHAQQTNLNQWEELAHYGQLLAYGGHTTALNWEDMEIDLIRDNHRLADLYETANELGAIYSDASEYEQEALVTNSNEVRSIVVNPNYLEQFPLKDGNNKTISIQEEETDWIVIVPEKYRDRKGDLTRYFNDHRDFYIDEENGQSLKFVWSQSGQTVFSFNTEVFPNHHNQIVDPILHVKTKANDLFVFRGGIRGEGINNPLKIPIVSTVEQTERLFQPALQALRIDDRVVLRSLSDTVARDIAHQESELRSIIGFMIVTGLVFFLLLIQGCLLFFDKNGKIISIKRLFGIRFYARYKRYLLLTLSIWFGIGVLLYGGVKLELLETASFSALSVVYGGFLLVELSFVMATFLYIERRNLVHVLKGENH